MSALRKLATLLAPNGRIAISLRLGEPHAAGAIHVVSLSELTALGQQFGLRLLHSNDSEISLGRAGVSWSTAVLGLPDNGLSALPLLRHLALVDEKSSTYKITLLRILARIERLGPADILDAMKVHRIRLAKDQGLRA